MIFSQREIEELAEEVKLRLSDKRFSHTLGVARAALMLAQYCGEDTSEAQAAALLHDITKEYSEEEEKGILAECAIALDEEDIACPQIWHAFTAPYVIRKYFPAFATERVLSAVYNHTVGSPDMTVFDEIIFLADFIEDTRIYEASRCLFEYVVSQMRSGETDNNIRILHKACIMAIDYTASHLTKNKRHVNQKNILTKNALLSKI